MHTAKYLEVISLTERLHRQFLDLVKLELESLRVRNVNNVLDELDRRAEKRCGSPRFCDALLRLAMCRRFPARAHDQMRRPPGKRLLNDHPPATELDVIWMCAEGQHRQSVRGVDRCRLHLSFRSRPGGQK